MRKWSVKKKSLVFVATSIGIASVAVGTTFAVLKINKKDNTQEINTQISYENNLKIIQSITNQSAGDSIELSTLKKSLKMSLDLCRGGVFDVAQANIFGLSVSNAEAAEYSELINFIDNASIDQAISFNSNFTKIKFIKTSGVAFKDVYNIQKYFDESSNKPDWLIKAKQYVWNWGVDQVRGLQLRHYAHGKLNDYNFFSNNDKDENQFYDFVSDADWNNYFRYQKSDGTIITYDQAKELIEGSSNVDELRNVIFNELSRPIVVFNLLDKFLAKFSNVVATKNHFSQDSLQGQNTVNVQLNREWDPVFGTKNSWYQFKPFQSNYYQKNIISPMFLINKQGHSNRDDGDEFYINDYEIDGESINYSMPQSYEQIIKYKSSEHKFNNGLIPLNETRYFENKLHEQQNPDHGFIPMSDVDMYNETMTANWYPHIRQEYPTMWQYISKYVQWGWKTTWPTPIQVDTAHKNGAEIFGTWFNDSPSSMILRLLADTESNRYIWADNLIQMMKDTGVDGMFWNAEVGGWSRSGITEGAWKGWTRLMNYLNVQLEKENKKLIIHPLFDSEVPRTPQDRIAFLQDGDTESDYREVDTWRWGMSPANAEADIYHYDENYNLLDQPLGYAHKNGKHDLYLGFVDKPENGGQWSEELDKYGAVAQARQRAEFVKANPEYNLIVMGSDSLGDWWNGSTRDYINKEMKFLKENNISNQYYGDYMNFADGAGVADYREKFEWEMSQYVARTNEMIATGEIIDNPGNGYTSQNDTKFSAPNGWFGKGDWKQLSQDPRSESGAYSNFYQERSTIGDKNFYTAFNIGYGHNFMLNGNNIYDQWQNIGFQDFYPSYRYLIDVFDKNGQLIDDSSSNFTTRKINAAIDEVNDAFQGNDALHYSGILKQNESFVNKLYISNITSDKDFSIYVKNVDALTTSLQVWRNKQQASDEIMPYKSEAVNGYKKLSFHAPASDTSKITSFGLKVKNTSLENRDVDLKNYRVGAISFENQNASAPDHSSSISNFYAETNNVDDNGINVKFDDTAFDENSRYVIYDEHNMPVAISSRPEFHVNQGGKYTIKVFDPVGNNLGTSTVTLNELIFHKNV